MLGMFGAMLTSTGAQQLLEDGKMQLDDPVQKHIPELALKQDWGGEWLPSMTMRHLLECSSGLPWDTNPPNAWLGSADNILNDYVVSTDFAGWEWL